MDEPASLPDSIWLLEALPFAAALLRKDGQIARSNAAWRAQPGGDHGTLQAWVGGIGAEAHLTADILAGVGSILSGQNAGYNRDIALSRAGVPAAFHLLATAPKGDRFDGALLILHDTTDLRHTRLELAAREEQLRSIINTVPDSIIVIDASGLIESFSGAAERQFGYEAADVIGRNVSMLMPSPYREAHDSYVARYLATGERRIIGIGRVVVGRRKDGTTFPMELQVGEANHAGQKRFIGYVRDLTEKQTTEARLQELQTDYLHESRLHSLGEMAAQLAHELNQPLAATSNYLKAALMLLDRGSDADPARLRQAVELAAQQTTRAGDIIRQLREFVARGQTEMRAESIAKLIQESSALALVGARLRGIATRIDIAVDLPPVRADRVQIQQVLLNLMRNAIDAMEAGPRRELTVHAERVAGMVEISVADTGIGINPEIAARLFQPFVTTKKDGMGIGLSTSRAIVEAHGGRLWWQPVPTGGTQFCFNLLADDGQHADVAKHALDQ